MKNIINLLVIILMLSGAALLFYPTASNFLATQNHTKAIQEYNESVESLNGVEIEKHLQIAKQYNETFAGKTVLDPFSEDGKAFLSSEYYHILNINGVMGYIEIPSLSIYLPIYHTTSDEVLKKGVGHLETTGFPIGGNGNHAVLTAHRGLPSAKLFSDLNQFETGDYFLIHVLGDVYAYQGEQIVVVEPDDTRELQPVAGQDLVTLVTCTPYAINSHRLLVRGARVDYAMEDEIFEIAATAKTISNWVWVAIIFILLAGICAGFYRYKKRKI